MLPENVVKLNENTLYDDIEAFFSEFDSQVINDPRYNKNGVVKKSATRVTYERGIREFCRVVLNKDLEHLAIDDLINVKKKDIIEYRMWLLEKGNSNKTVNNKVTALKSLYKFLSSDYSKLSDKIFNIKRLKEVTEPYATLSQSEAERFAEAAFFTERQKPYLKKMLIMFAIRSSFRIDEILTMRWKDFEPVPEERICIIKCIGKGSKGNTNSISMNLYNDILKLKELNKETKWDNDPELVFQIDEKTVNKMMSRLKKKLGVPDDRRVVFHSFRGIAIDFALENGDIRSAAQQANHSNIATTYKHYINKSKDYTMTPGVRMDMELDYSIVDDVDEIEVFKEFFKQSSNYKLFVEFQKHLKQNGK